MAAEGVLSSFAQHAENGDYGRGYEGATWQRSCVGPPGTAAIKSRGGGKPRRNRFRAAVRMLSGGFG